MPRAGFKLNLMKFTDEGYIINLRKHGERSLILTVLTREHGKATGYVKNGLSRKNLSTFQLGNKIKLEAYARVDENMLIFQPELITPAAVNFMSDEGRLQALSSFCALSNICMPELQPLEDFYTRVDVFFNLISEDNWVTNYICFEFCLLDFLGIGLDLSECAVSGTTQNLAYISPKSGRAVCAEVGEPYKDKLYKFPYFIFRPETEPTAAELKDALAMTGFFLNKNFFAAHGLKFPESRVNLAGIVI